MKNSESVFIDVARDSYKRSLFNAIVAPRPIGWISTVDDQGRANLAPFSYFNIVSSQPPILAFSCNTPEDRDAKDTLANVRKTGEFVFNLVSFQLAQVMNDTSSPHPHGVDEFEHVGIEKAASRYVAPPRVALAPAAMECRVLRIVSFGGDGNGPQTNVTFGEVLGVHIAPGFLEDTGNFDTLAAQPVVRFGAAGFAISQPPFSLQSQFTRVSEAKY